MLWAAAFIRGAARMAGIPAQPSPGVLSWQDMALAADSIFMAIANDGVPVTTGEKGAFSGYQQGREAGIEEGHIQGRREANAWWRELMDTVMRGLNAVDRTWVEATINSKRHQAPEEPGAEPEAEVPDP